MHPLFLPSERPSERPSFRYFRQFAEQLIPVSRGFLGMDTSCKILARSLEGGDRTEIRNKFTMMSNECVSIKGTIATASGGPHEESVEQMLDAFFKSLSEEERKGVRRGDAGSVGVGVNHLRGQMVVMMKRRNRSH